jgi:putative ABC transport system ATP-binding protein
MATLTAQAAAAAALAPDEPIVICRNVSRVYRVGGEDIFAVRDVSCEIYRGKLYALRGRSGSGKTTLLNLMSGLDKPTSGRTFILGNETTRMSDAELTELRRHFIGFVFQTFALLPVLSAYENVELPMRIAGVPARERARRTVDLLELVGLGKRMHHRPFELSGGEQERVAIARALANDPGFIVADEPTGELDSVTGLQIMLLFKRIVQERGVTIIMATHDPTISEIADETLIMTDGRISREIPEELQGTGILDAMHLPGTLHGEIELAAARSGLADRSVAGATIQERLDRASGKDVQLPPLPSARPPQPATPAPQPAAPPAGAKPAPHPATPPPDAAKPAPDPARPASEPAAPPPQPADRLKP